MRSTVSLTVLVMVCAMPLPPAEWAPPSSPMAKMLGEAPNAALMSGLADSTLVMLGLVGAPAMKAAPCVALAKAAEALPIVVMASPLAAPATLPLVEADSLVTRFWVA